MAVPKSKRRGRKRTKVHPGTMTPRQWGFAATATAAMLVPALLHGVTPMDWVNLSNSSGVEAVPPGPGDVLGTLALTENGALGATGRLPETDEVSAALLADADDPSEFEDDLPPLEGGFLREGQHGIPGVMLDAYMRAADRLAETTPGCNLDWPLLASIGRIESGHARGGRVTEDGTTVNPILGPVLNGGPGMAAISDTDDGRFDGDRTWDRAVGPMQFIPSTWAGYAADGNEDGERNPNNIYDATIGAGNYLCAYGADVSDPVQRARSVFRYNHSDEYVRTVLYWADAYASGVTTLPDLVGSDDDFVQDQSSGTPPNTTAPPGTTNPPSQGTSNPATTTTTTIPGVTITLTPTETSTTTTTPPTTTTTCPTVPTETTTSTSSAAPTTTQPIPPGCPTPTTTTTTEASVPGTTAAQTTPAQTTPAQTTVPGSTSGGSSNSSSGSSSGGPTMSSSMSAT